MIVKLQSQVRGSYESLVRSFGAGLLPWYEGDRLNITLQYGVLIEAETIPHKSPSRGVGIEDRASESMIYQAFFSTLVKNPSTLVQITY